ncbi:MAG: sel1 repeat family protein [Rhodospirillaceae bacterium]|nr:sel1 repeat family protein [Rhodospirillaceae bacterium]MBT6830100.1 sel1 repeat family protein [Rhodospirillaceae bacterium]
MRNIQTVIISSALLIAVTGCTSSGNDFFASLWGDVMAPDAPDSTQFAEDARAPRLALSVGHGAVLRDVSGYVGAGDPQAIAMKMWRQKAENGDAAAQFKLASAYRMGLNGAPDPHAALKWYGAAAARDNASAQHHLGYMYAMADGVSRDLVAAYKWLNLAVVNLPPGWEHNQAVTNREHVARELRPAEIAEAHSQTQQWVRAKGSASEPKFDQTAGSIAVEVEFQELGFLENLDPFMTHSRT